MVGAPSPGKWLRRNLYRLLPYQRIKTPCPPAGCGVTTTCCGTLPTTLHATGDTGLGTVPLVYDGSFYWVSDAAPVNCGASIKLRLYCSAGGSDCSTMLLQYTCDGGTLWHNAVTNPFTCNCTPLSLQFSGVLNFFSGCAPCNTTISITVTI